MFPEFVFKDENNKEFDSRMLEGVRHIIYFYPKNNTPGCTKEAVKFTMNVLKLMMKNISVIGEGLLRVSQEVHLSSS